MDFLTNGAKHKRQTEARLSRAAVDDAIDAASTVQHRRQRRRHSFGCKIQSIPEIALSSAVATDQERGIGKSRFVPGETSEADKFKRLKNGFHGSPRDRQEHGIEQPLFVAAF